MSSKTTLFFSLLLLAVQIATVTARPMHSSSSHVQFLHSRARVHGVQQHHQQRHARRSCPRRSTNTTTTASAVVEDDTSAIAISSSSASVVASSSTSSSAIPSKASSSSSAKASSTSISNNKNLLASLFPVSSPISSWSTSPESSSPLPLSDSTFNPIKVISALTHTYLSAPDGTYSMRAQYPQGSYNFQHEPLGGISFYAPGPSDVDLTTAKEATLGYSVFFEDGFDFNMGGKLPGLYGGDSSTDSFSCSGGARSSTCFSVRLMWRTSGAGELYTYLPPAFSANDVQCSVPPKSECNPTYGASVGRGSFEFTPGQWTTVSERVRLNDVGQENGEMELFVGGVSVVSVKGLVLRDSEEGRLRGIMMQTFFGGSTSDWASPKDQDAYFSDFSVAITENL